MDRPITFAHRGARAVLPENTLPAFRRALELGAGGLETDAWLSADGEVVLVHDQTIRRPLRRVSVSRLSAEQLARHDVPRLADLYRELGAGYELSIDVKEERAGEAVVAVAREHGDPERLWICSPSIPDLESLRGLAPEVKLVHSVRKRRIHDPLERHAAKLASAGIDAMNMPHPDWTAGIVTLFHRFEVLAFAWNVQEVRDLRAMLDADIDAVYCDRTDRMVAVVGEWRAETG